MQVDYFVMILIYTTHNEADNIVQQAIYKCGNGETKTSTCDVTDIIFLKFVSLPL